MNYIERFAGTALTFVGRQLIRAGDLLGFEYVHSEQTYQYGLYPRGECYNDDKTNLYSYDQFYTPAGTLGVPVKCNYSERTIYITTMNKYHQFVNSSMYPNVLNPMFTSNANVQKDLIYQHKVARHRDNLQIATPVAVTYSECVIPFRTSINGNSNVPIQRFPDDIDTYSNGPLEDSIQKNNGEIIFPNAEEYNNEVAIYSKNKACLVYQKKMLIGMHETENIDITYNSGHNSITLKPNFFLVACIWATINLIDPDNTEQGPNGYSSVFLQFLLQFAFKISTSSQLSDAPGTAAVIVDGWGQEPAAQNVDLVMNLNAYSQNGPAVI